MYWELCATLRLGQPGKHSHLSWSPLAWAVNPQVFGGIDTNRSPTAVIYRGTPAFYRRHSLDLHFLQWHFHLPVVSQIASLHPHSHCWVRAMTAAATASPCLPSSKSFCTLPPRGSVQKGGLDQLLPAYKPSMTPQRQNFSKWPLGSVCFWVSFCNPNPPTPSSKHTHALPVFLGPSLTSSLFQLHWSLSAPHTTIFSPTPGLLYMLFSQPGMQMSTHVSPISLKYGRLFNIRGDWETLLMGVH